MRLYHAICAWIKAQAEALRDGDEDHAEGDNVTTTELGDVLPLDPELHASHRGQSIDDDGARANRQISLRWTPPSPIQSQFKQHPGRTGRQRNR